MNPRLSPEPFDPRPTVDILRARGVIEPVRLLIVLGTGLIRLEEEIQGAVKVAYADLPGFPMTGVSGHPGQLVVGRLHGRRVALMQGRAHYYETGDASAMRGAFEVLKALGCDTIVMTNAAGAIRPDWYPGSLALIADHINFTGINPLLGERGDERFVSMVDAYDQRLRRKLKLAAQASGQHVHEGVYMWFTGPSFETPAEIRMAKALGADLVGMSTVPEVILARRLGFDVAALSVVTNQAAGIGGARPDHGETKTVAISGSVALRRLLGSFVKLLEE
jgi:purine-nucleoside phosphorylase